MCGKAYDPRFVFAWPTAKYAVMSGDAAAGTLVEIKVKQLERGGKKLSDEEGKSCSNRPRKHTKSKPIRVTAPPVSGSTKSSIPSKPARRSARSGSRIAQPRVPEFKVGVLQT